MEYLYLAIGAAILLMLSDVKEKLNQLLKKEKQTHIDLSRYLHKDVYIVINNDNVTDSYLFNTMIKTIGRIVDYDDEWFAFSYYNKNKKQTITQYMRIADLESINEIK